MNFRALASGDLHIDASGPRADECRRILEWINVQIEEQRPDAYLCTGDVYHAASTPEDRLLAVEHFTRAAAVCPVFIARGNHDKLSDLEILARLGSAYGIVVEERSKVHLLTDETALAIMAWPSRSSLAAMLGIPVGSQGLDDAGRAAMREVLTGINEQWHGTKNKILLGHFMCNGSVTSTGQPLIGTEMSIGTEDLDLAGADVVVMGHIHKPQEFDAGSTCPKYYCGSPYRTAFGETEDKSILSVQFGPDGRSIQRLLTPSTKMILSEARWECGKLNHVFDDSFSGRGCEVRLRYTVPKEFSEQARKQAETLRVRMMSAGARSVKLEAVIETHTRARDGAEGVAKALTFTEKLDQYWAMRGDVPSAERRAGLLQKLGTLEVNT